jgi:Skp family chaperone for outer membrane proteins
MNSKILAGLAGLLGLAFLAQAHGEASYAVCNLSKLYQDSSVSKDKRAELEALRTKAEKELQSYKGKIDELLRKKPLYEKDSPEYKEIDKNIEDLKNEAGAKKRVETTNLQRKFTDFLKKFHRLATESIEDHAKEQGIAFVFQVQNTELGRFTKAEPLLQKIFTQQVLYNVRSVDITDKVLKRLDKDYENNK